MVTSAGVPNYQKWIFLKVAWLMLLQNALVLVSCQPRDTVAIANQSISFNCSTVRPGIVWYRYAVGSDEALGGDVIYRSGNVLAKYKADYRVDEYNTNGTHFCNLIINTAKESFAGKYECRDNNGVGVTLSAQLIVIDSDPVCRPYSEPLRIIGLNDCGLEREQMELSCNVTFSGNSPPILKWTADVVQVQDVLNVTHKTVNNQVISNVTVNSGNYIHDAKFMCWATQSIDKEQLCTFDVSVLYAMNTTIKIDKVVGEEVNCSINTSSHSCRYEWIKHDGKASSTISNSSVLKIGNSGLHQCQATCNLLDNECLIFGTTVNASEAATGTNFAYGPSGGAVAGIVIGILILVILLLCLVVFCWNKRRKLGGFGKEIPISVQHEDTSKALLSNSDAEQQHMSFRLTSTRAESPGSGKEITISVPKGETSEALLSNSSAEQRPMSFHSASAKEESAGTGKEIPISVPKEETSETLLSNSSAEQRPMSFHSASAKKESAGEDGFKKRKRSEDGIFDESVEPGVEMGSPENSLHPQAVASGIHDDSLFEYLTANDPDNSEKPIAGIAIYKEKLFIVFERSSRVEVFHVITFAFEDSFVIKNLSRPLDIASCPAKNCFFIYALGINSSGEILAIDKCGNLLSSWKTGEGVGCLSVALDYSVILSAWSNSLLKVYSFDGQHSKDVKLPLNILPFHAVKVTEDEFLIGYAEKNQKIHGIFLANSNGELIRNYPEKGDCTSYELLSSSYMPLSFPRYLSLTSDGECLIADSKNKRILLLKRTFEIVEILSAEDGLIRPVRICFDHSIVHKFFVADNGDRNPRVMIYELPSND